MTKAKKRTGWRKALPKRLSELQKDVEKQLRKGFEQATDMLPPAPRKAVKRLTDNVEKARKDLLKRTDKMAADARKRAERFGTQVQKRVEGAITPFTRGLDVASRTEVERLRRRLDHLERRLEHHAEPPAATA